MLFLIVNADDFGKCHEVNVAIEDQIKRGCITSTTIMANANGFAEAIQIAKQHPNVSYGIHLCLDEYAPITEQHAFFENGIVDAATGLFVKGQIWNVCINESLKKAVKEEWDAQIQKIRDAGIVPSHVDSHHHVHTIPALKEILLDVLNKHNIRRVRGCDYVSVSKYFRGWQHFQDTNRVKEFIYLILRIPRFYNCRKWVNQIQETIKMTDDFCSVLAFCRNQRYFEKYYKDQIVELECHPGHVNYCKETEMLKLLSGYNRISYNDL